MKILFLNITFILGLLLFSSNSSGAENAASESSSEDAFVSYIQNTSLSRERLVSIIDSLLETDSVSTRVLDALNKKLMATQAFYQLPIDTTPYPAHELYTFWDTEHPNCYSPSLSVHDTTFNFALTDSMNFCGFVMPADGIVTSMFGPRDGRMHNGIDIDLETGDTVKAAFVGMVRVAKFYSSFGNVIVIRHYNGFETVYAHLSHIDVKPGDIVDPGQLIGLGGNTGRSRGSHLHFEMRFKGIPVNPRYVIDLKKRELVSEAVVIKKTKSGFTVRPQGLVYHTVKKGDYPYKIAAQYGITVAQLNKLNGLGKKSVLVKGKQLRVSL